MNLFILLIDSGKRHGRGEYLYNDGSKYIGTWDNDKINGEGTSWYPNGNKYGGHFALVLVNMLSS